MTRKTYGGYGITELRQCAKEYKIAGRTKMDGWDLLAAVRAYWEAERQRKEQELLAAAKVEPGVLLRHKSTGDVIRVLTNVVTWEPYGALCVDAEYVEVDGWGDDRRTERAAYLNRGDAERRARGVATLHPLYQYEAMAS